MKRFTKIILIILFLALLATPFIVKKFYNSVNSNIDKETAMKRYGFYFEEVARNIGRKIYASRAETRFKTRQYYAADRFDGRGRFRR